ncbi:MAG: PEGA domain-containing protein [Trueperaceae bacterium]|nr:MAG: PEGA domain-containing protein [Trueperaceae bacterium]
MVRESRYAARTAFLTILFLLLGSVAAQISLPVFGTRGDVPEGLLARFMDLLREVVADTTDLEVRKGDLITAGIAGSLEPAFAGLIAELDGSRYAVSGEIARVGASEEQSPYFVNLIIVDVERERSSDLISQPLRETTLVQAATVLGQIIASFTAPLTVLPEGEAGLFISSQPAEAKVFIDGVLVGETSKLDPLRLASGRYRIELRKEGFLPEVRTVDLHDSDTRFVHFVLTSISGGSIQVSSQPSARVYLDDQFQGVTPFTLPALPGVHTIRLERDGFVSKSFSVPVRNYRVTRVSTSLDPLIDPLVFWSEDREYLVFIGSVLQVGGYAPRLRSGTTTFDVRKGAEQKLYTVEVPERGVFELDLHSGELSPFFHSDSLE